VKYNLEVNVRIRPEQYGSALELREENAVELTSLSDAARILVKLHELFEEVRRTNGKA